jgi:hypothetical protein
MEHTNIYDVYMLLFDETNTEQVDKLLATIDESLDALVDWDNADSHFRFHSHEKLNIVGIQPRGKRSDFWKKHFAGFVKNTIPTVINASHLHQPPKGRQNNRVQPHIAILPVDMVTVIMKVMLQAQLRPKLQHKHDQEPYQVPGSKVVRLGRPA